VLAAEILFAHQRFEAEGWSTFADQWKALDWLAGQSVNIHRESGMEQGVVKGVDHRGALLVEREGKMMSVVGGDVSIRPTV
jgi:BirA family biotin operon repressor/biotin-[acetyl-CoA-carboxylase] ligase